MTDSKLGVNWAKLGENWAKTGRRPLAHPVSLREGNPAAGFPLASEAKLGENWAKTGLTNAEQNRWPGPPLAEETNRDGYYPPNSLMLFDADVRAQVRRVA